MATQPDSTILSTKGQVILPKAIRDQKHWAAGMRLIVENRPDGVLLKPEPLFKPTTMDEVYGSLKYDGPAKSIEEMDASVLEEAKRHA